VGTPDDKTVFQTVFISVRVFLKNVVCYRNHGLPYADFHLLQTGVFDLLDEVLDQPNHMLPGV
jgi:hypothetical protein